MLFPEEALLHNVSSYKCVACPTSVFLVKLAAVKTLANPGCFAPSQAYIGPPTLSPPRKPAFIVVTMQSLVRLR